jgi:hypothetical protein
MCGHGSVYVLCVWPQPDRSLTFVVPGERTATNTAANSLSGNSRFQPHLTFFIDLVSSIQAIVSGDSVFLIAMQHAVKVFGINQYVTFRSLPAFLLDIYMMSSALLGGR